MGACDCDCYENLMGRLEKRYMSITKNTNSQIEKTNTLIKNFDCNNCTKEKVCKYKEIEVPEIITKVETRINNEYCPSIINFTVSCKEFQKNADFLTRK